MTDETAVTKAEIWTALQTTDPTLASWLATFRRRLGASGERIEVTTADGDRLVWEQPASPPNSTRYGG